mmetsp:Transcript_18142/g.47348  ORF Transcript_18142/g.47348 Transcript_18142/m.47348 type:complete len:300 (+) Transcript_18142:485-1384(+)
MAALRSELWRLGGVGAGAQLATVAPGRAPAAGGLRHTERRRGGARRHPQADTPQCIDALCHLRDGHCRLRRLHLRGVASRAGQPPGSAGARGVGRPQYHSCLHRQAGLGLGGPGGPRAAIWVHLRGDRARGAAPLAAAAARPGSLGLQWAGLRRLRRLPRLLHGDRRCGAAAADGGPLCGRVPADAAHHERPRAGPHRHDALLCQVGDGVYRAGVLPRSAAPAPPRGRHRHQRSRLLRPGQRGAQRQRPQRGGRVCEPAGRSAAGRRCDQRHRRRRVGRHRRHLGRRQQQRGRRGQRQP